MLAVGVHQQDDLAAGGTNARLHRRAVADVVGMGDQASGRVRPNDGRRVVGRAIVHDEDLIHQRLGGHLIQDVADHTFFVVDGHHHRHALRIEHRPAPPAAS